MAKLTRELIQKYDTQGPRYTSYPTAPEWESNFSQTHYQDCLKLFGSSHKSLSLYFHIPFCNNLCRFCGCNVVIRRQNNGEGQKYLTYIDKEMALIRKNICKKPLVKQLHLGGGTPNFLTTEELDYLIDRIHHYFDLEADCEIATEIDPRVITSEKLAHIKKVGFNRVSYGIQDFNKQVQEHIDRLQPFELVKKVFEQSKQLRFDSINFDLIYGLPYQTKTTFSETIAKVLDLKPDRIALYSFAYIPWIKSHQKLLNTDEIPTRDEKLDIFLMAKETLLQAGYDAIAMDHFALKTDEMAKAAKTGKLHRNFMGYTLKPADEFLGLGATSIGYIEKTFIQNTKDLKDYYARLDRGDFAVERGKSLSKDDEIRQWVIQSFMCGFEVNQSVFYDRFGVEFDLYFNYEKPHIVQCFEDNLLKINGDTFLVTDLGRYFIRNICMGFDWYLRKKPEYNKFSKTI